jgi:hypothetical protein
MRKALIAAGLTVGDVGVLYEDTDPVVFMGYAGKACIGKLGFWVSQNVFIFNIPALEPVRYPDLSAAMVTRAC